MKSIIFTLFTISVSIQSLSASSLHCGHKRDSVVSIDTLVQAEDWEKKDYKKTQIEAGYVESKIIFFSSNQIEIKQEYWEKEDKYMNKTLKYNDTDYNINDLYFKTYHTGFNDQLYFMGNLVTAKKYKRCTTIDLLIVENNCLGSFCNDVTILTLKIDNNGKLTCYFHDEDLETYGL